MLNFIGDLALILSLLGPNLAAILILIGAFSLLLAIVGNLGPIQAPPSRQRRLAVFGTLFVLIGTGLYAETQYCSREQVAVINQQFEAAKLRLATLQNQEIEIIARVQGVKRELDTKIAQMADVQRVEDIGPLIKEKESRLKELRQQEVTAEGWLLDAERQRLAAQLATKQAQRESLLATEAKTAAELALKLANTRLADSETKRQLVETELNGIVEQLGKQKLELAGLQPQLEAAKQQLEEINKQIAEGKDKVDSTVSEPMIADRYRYNCDGTVTDTTTILHRVITCDSLNV